MSNEKLDRPILNCILAIPLIPMKARFLSQFDNFGSPSLCNDSSETVEKVEAKMRIGYFIPLRRKITIVSPIYILNLLLF